MISNTTKKLFLSLFIVLLLLATVEFLFSNNLTIFNHLKEKKLNLSQVIFEDAEQLSSLHFNSKKEPIITISKNGSTISFKNLNLKTKSIYIETHGTKADIYGGRIDISDSFYKYDKITVNHFLFNPKHFRGIRILR